MSGLPGFFDFDDWLRRLSDLGDQLEAFGKTVDFEMFRVELLTALDSTGVSGISCAGVRLNNAYALAAWKRSAKRMANWLLAMAHSLGGIFHSFSDLFKTRNRSFIAASSVGKCPLARTARRSLEFKASMALVV